MPSIVEMLMRPELILLSPRGNLQLRTLSTQGHLISRLKIFSRYKKFELELEALVKVGLFIGFQGILSFPSLNTNKPRLGRTFLIASLWGIYFFIVYYFY